MANRRPTSSKRPRPQSQVSGGGEDAFSAFVLNLTTWAGEHSRILVALAAVVVLAALGTFYWFNQRSAQLDAAAQQLESLQQEVGFDDPATATASIQGFLDRFGGTPYGVEGRMLMARVQLVGNSDPATAITTLQAVAPDYDTPVGLEATFMLAAAFEQAERWDEAASIYSQLRTSAEFSFQKVNAGDGLARVRLAQGDTAAAIEAYRTILDQIEPDDQNRGEYEMDLAELTAGGD